VRGRALARLLAIAVCVTGVVALAPATGWAGTPPLSVSAAILVAPGTSQELYGVNPEREVPIASTTKLMTALVTLEHIHHLSTVLTAPNYYASSVDSQIGLVPGERMSVHDLLLALLLPSADDAAEDLAYNIGHGSVARFVGMMNAEARELGLRHTHYSTPIGLDTPGNYSTAADLVKLASYDMTHSAYFARVVALRSAVLQSGDHVRYVVNRNDLVGEVPWINGVKTGHTAGAGYVLVASGHRDGMTLLSAVLGTASEGERDANTMALLDYGFNNFHQVTPVVAGRVVARPTVRDRPGFKAAVIAAATFTRVLARRDRVRVAVQMPTQLVGPLRRHAQVGTAVVLADGRPVARVPLLLARALPAVSGLTIAARFISRPLMLVIFAGVLAALAAVVVALRRRSRSTSGDLEAA
jgi:D-alanyl-D-alanine carboxypeptidase (penicillin-binding protein 5/6)